MAEIMTIVFSRLSAHPKTPLCKGSWHGAAVTEGLTAIIMIKFHLAFGGAGPFTRLN